MKKGNKKNVHSISNALTRRRRRRVLQSLLVKERPKEVAARPLFGMRPSPLRPWGMEGCL